MPETRPKMALFRAQKLTLKIASSKLYYIIITLPTVSW
ncbi:hypothetical protein M23134_05770 [Microscilla marina ATCC 23134]|uniref:Uncharacterized protein n=1 Tax=Microscilla marina ATCC 23134 TaxID=313606 RepID=A1ZIM9_MICM2|nr:hypothetical protein M23134_05770 [Microscilla marina ATCC 23134]